MVLHFSLNVLQLSNSNVNGQLDRMDLFPEFSLIEDYGFYEWRPVDKDHSRFTRDDILWGLHGSETDRAGTKPPYVNQDVFKSRLADGKKLHIHTLNHLTLLTMIFVLLHSSEVEKIPVIEI